MVIAEVMMTGAGRDDQTIIAHRTAIQQDAPTNDIDTGRLRQKHMSVLVALEDGAHGCCDIGRGEPWQGRASRSRPGRATVETDENCAGQSGSPLRFLDTGLREVPPKPPPTTTTRSVFATV